MKFGLFYELQLPKPADRDQWGPDAERRMLNEPLAEIIQGKGQSDTSPELSKNDEFARFEMWKYLVGTSTVAKSATGSYGTRCSVSWRWKSWSDG